MAITVRGNGSPDYTSKGAVISGDKLYRYSLWREWRGTPDAKWAMWQDDDLTPIVDGAGSQLGEPLSCVFVMLNPSTADGDQDDPTIRRCVAFARSWGYDRMEVVNLFAYRATDPKVILGLGGGDVDPVGRDNQNHIQRAVERAGIVVCAWGANGDHICQDETVLGWLEGHDAPLHALRVTKDGHPCHPLYLPADLKPFRWEGRA